MNANQKRKRKEMKKERRKDLFLEDSVPTKAYPLLSEVTFQACDHKINSIKFKHAYIKLHCAILQQRGLKFCIQFRMGRARKVCFYHLHVRELSSIADVLSSVLFVILLLGYFFYGQQKRPGLSRFFNKVLCGSVVWKDGIFHRGGRRKICTPS